MEKMQNEAKHRDQLKTPSYLIAACRSHCDLWMTRPPHHSWWKSLPIPSSLHHESHMSHHILVHMEHLSVDPHCIRGKVNKLGLASGRDWSSFIGPTGEIGGSFFHKNKISKDFNLMLLNKISSLVAVPLGNSWNQPKDEQIICDSENCGRVSHLVLIPICVEKSH